MAKQILVRDVPDTIHNWIDDERNQRRMTKQEFLLSVLESASASNDIQPSLFDVPRSHDNGSTGDLPFTFIDLFAGIGGLRIPLEAAGGRCVFSSEIDRYSQKTYKAWFGETPHGDITKISAADIPDHDFLAARVFLASRSAWRESPRRTALVRNTASAARCRARCFLTWHPSSK